MKPGETDPNPETKPARPDAVDMDEDEKEMLSEARARLSNTKGKKAKRKVREKQLEEARRLAVLQKRRELKAAGILSTTATKIRRRGGRDKRDVDHYREIAFEHAVPLGFHAVGGSDERPPRDEDFAPKAKKDAEGGKTLLERQDAQSKQAQKRVKQQKEENLPEVLAKIAAEEDAAGPRKRTKLSLPAPLTSEQDLETLARLEREGLLEAALARAEGATAITGTLVAPTPSVHGGGAGATPALSQLRTPRRTEKSDSLLSEARNIIAFNSAPTPLLGGSNAPIAASDFAGAMPRKPTPSATPALRTPSLRTPSGSVAATPLRIGQSEAGSVAGGGSRKSAHKALLADLASLPRPVNVYSLKAPSGAANGAASSAKGAAVTAGAVPGFTPALGTAPLIEDAADTIEKAHQRERDLAELALQLRPLPTRRGLPRPVALLDSPAVVTPDFSQATCPEARSLVHDTVLLLLANDLARFPHPTSTQVAAGSPDALPALTPSELTLTERLISDELTVMNQGNREFQGSPLEAQALAAVLGADFLFVPSLDRFVSSEDEDKAKVLEGIVSEASLLSDFAANEAKRNDKIEKKLSVLLKGYQVLLTGNII